MSLKYSKERYQYLQKRGRLVCGICHEPMLKEITIDHKIPKSLGGDNSNSNLQPAHSSCNIRRGNMNLRTFQGLIHQQQITSKALEVLSEKDNGLIWARDKRSVQKKIGSLVIA